MFYEDGEPRFVVVPVHTKELSNEARVSHLKEVQRLQGALNGLDHINLIMKNLK